MSPIYHMNYSENLSQMYESGPQSSHFSKAQYSLQCTVKHDLESENLYLYHMSDAWSHGNAVTVAVVHHILSLKTPPDIIRFKLDSCSMWYKSKYFLFLVVSSTKACKNAHYVLCVLDHDSGCDTEIIEPLKEPELRIKICKGY